MNEAELTISELLGGYARTLAELRRRGVVRSNNAPVGDYAEYLVAKAVDGVLVDNFSVKSYDVVADKWGKVQVKARVVSDPPGAGELQTSPFRSWDFDYAALVQVRKHDYGVHRAWMIPVATTRTHARHRPHVNGHVVYMRAPLTEGPGVVDLTDELRRAAHEYDASTDAGGSGPING